MIADLPTWTASASIVHAPSRRGILSEIGLGRFGSLPEPTTWALLLVGFGMIGGALRGLIMANRRLSRLRSEDPS